MASRISFSSSESSVSSDTDARDVDLPGLTVSCMDGPERAVSAEKDQQMLGAGQKGLLERIEENSNSDYESSHAHSVRRRLNEATTPLKSNTSEIAEEPFGVISEVEEKPKSFVERSQTQDLDFGTASESVKPFLNRQFT